MSGMEKGKGDERNKARTKRRTGPGWEGEEREERKKQWKREERQVRNKEERGQEEGKIEGEGKKVEDVIDTS